MEDESCRAPRILLSPTKLYLPTGAVTGIGSLPFDSASAPPSIGRGILAGNPILAASPQLTPQEGLIAQGLDILGELIERRSAGYGYEVKAGRTDQALDLLHRSNAMITATCGLGLLDAGAVEESFRLAHGVGQLFRKLWAVEEEAATPTGRSSS